MTKKSAKPKKTRTMERGLRRVPSPLLDSFSQNTIDRMAEIIEAILTNSRVLDKKTCWIIAQALLAVDFRRAADNEEKNRIIRKMNKHRNEGHNLGFSEDHIRAINRVILEKDQAGQLDNLAQRLLEKRRD